MLRAPRTSIRPQLYVDLTNHYAEQIQQYNIITWGQAADKRTNLKLKTVAHPKTAAHDSDP
jgi:hypothetical protein